MPKKRKSSQLPYVPNGTVFTMIESPEERRLFEAGEPPYEKTYSLMSSISTINMCIALLLSDDKVFQRYAYNRIHHKATYGNIYPVTSEKADQYKGVWSSYSLPFLRAFGDLHLIGWLRTIHHQFTQVEGDRPTEEFLASIPSHPSRAGIGAHADFRGTFIEPAIPWDMLEIVFYENRIPTHPTNSDVKKYHLSIPVVESDRDTIRAFLKKNAYPNFHDKTWKEIGVYRLHMDWDKQTNGPVRKGDGSMVWGTPTILYHRILRAAKVSNSIHGDTQRGFHEPSMYHDVYKAFMSSTNQTTSP